MRCATAVLVLLCAAPALSAQSKPPVRTAADHTAADETALQQLNAAFGDALATGNYKKAGSLWDEDGVLFSVQGEKFTGPAQIAGALSDVLQGSKISIQNTNLHWVSADVAVFQGSWQQVTTDGQTYSGLFMSVARRVGPDWKYVEVRAWVPGQ
jgi:ketosteroid isomerase-like protein